VHTTNDKFYFGLIDILVEWNLKKKIESLCKSIFNDKHGKIIIIFNILIVYLFILLKSNLIIQLLIT
jgi:hypothetical protein